MKKIIALFLMISSFWSCNDGNYDVPLFQFTEDVYGCGEYILYKTNEDKIESLVLTLTNGELGTEVGTEPYPISSSLEIIYRIFDTGIDGDYYCQAVPPATPTVIKEVIAETGEVIIVTSEIIKNDKVVGYSYDITLSDLLFLDNNDRIYFETFYFGVYEIAKTP